MMMMKATLFLSVLLAACQQPDNGDDCQSAGCAPDSGVSPSTESTGGVETPGLSQWGTGGNGSAMEADAGD